ncbi:tetratricopeptide repeat protein [Geminocystis sp. CENA526]|uniref:tetratricopeptide repeat protein n=1 Tax=Geminocystis sp. CENA526 TaxID=1355871 RepID=UPI003D6DF0C9
MSNLEKGLLAFEEKNYQETLILLKPLAEEGNPEAQCILGNIYHLGLGVNPNTQKAVKWYKKSAKQGYLIAKNNLKTIYLMEEIGKEALTGNF